MNCRNADPGRRRTRWWGKAVTLGAALLLLSTTARSQVSAYSFTQSAGTYTPITGTLVQAQTAVSASPFSDPGKLDDVVFTLANGTIPFTFTYNGVGYTGLRISANGFLTFGTTAPANDLYNPISGTTAYSGAIAAMGRDIVGGFGFNSTKTNGSNVLTAVSGFDGIVVGEELVGTGIPAGTTVTAIDVGAGTVTMSAAATADGTATGTGCLSGEIRYDIVGSPGSREFVVQWSNFRTFASGGTGPANQVFNFQVRLVETTNVIKIVYGTHVAITTDAPAQVGLRGATNAFATNVNNRLVNTTNNWATSLQGTSNSSTCRHNATAPATFPASGLTYTWTPPTPCTGMPTAGTIPASVLYCSTASVITATGTTTGQSGISFQWEESDDNGVADAWANAVGGSGATSTSYTTPVLTAPTVRYYRLRVTCSAEPGSPAYTNSAMVAPNNPPYLAYDGVSYAESFETWVNGCGTTDRPSANWRNTPITGNYSWRRDDQGASASWSFLTDGDWVHPVPPFPNGDHCAVFHSYGANTSGAVPGNLDLFVDMSTATGNTNLKFWYLNPSGSDKVTVFISTDGGSTFTQLGSAVGTSVSWSEKAFVVTTNSATTVIRLQATTDYGADDIGVDHFRLEAPLACEAPTILGVTNESESSAMVEWQCPDCTGDYYVEYGAPGFTPGTDANADGGTVIGPISGSTSASMPGLTLGSTYQVYLRQDCSDAFGPNSSPLSFTLDYCTAAASSPLQELIANVTIADINNSVTGTTTYEDFTSIVGTVAASLNYPISITGDVTSEVSEVRVWIDADHDLVFEPSELVFSQVGEGPYSGTVTIPSGSTPGLTRMRVRIHDTSFGGNTDACGQSFFGQVEDYTLSIAPVPTCFAPTDVAVVNITSDGGDITWTNNDAPMYEYEVRSSGAAGSGPSGLEATGTVSGGPVTLSGLSSLTGFTVYVRGVCSEGTDLSLWSLGTPFSTACEGFTCNHIIRMYDLYGDGWNGAELRVLQNGVPLMSGLTVPDECGPVSVMLPLCTSATVSIELTDEGAYPDELAMQFLDATGAELYSFRGPATENGSGDCDGLVYPTSANAVPEVGATAYSGTVVCPPCQAPAATATLNNDCSLGSFMVDVNITSIGNGASASITYTVNGGSPVTEGPFGTGPQSIGPFSTSDLVVVTLEHETSDDCNVALGSFTAAGVLCNDNCSGALTISCATPSVNGTTIGATVDAEYPNCGDGFGTSSTERGVWYRFVGDDSQVTITTCDGSGTGYDTRLSVYSGSCGAFTCVTSNDDMTPECTTPTFGFRSEVQFNAFAGTDYYVFVHGYQSGTTLSATGNFILNLSCSELCLPLPTNDVCASAEPLTIGTSCTPVTGTTACATATAGSNPNCFSAFATLPDVFYSFVADNDSAALTLNNLTASGTGIALYEGCGGDQVFCSLTASGTTILTDLIPDSTYVIRVLTPSSTAGTFEICLGPLPTPPANDECATAEALTVHPEEACVFTSGSTLLATPEAPSGSCQSPTYTPWPSNVYYSFVATGFANTVTLTFGEELTDAVNFVVRDACDGGAEKACVFAISGTAYPVTDLIEGNTYYVQVNTYDTQSSFNICVAESSIEAPANDDCANAEVLLVQPFDDCTPTTGTNVGAGPSSENPSCLNPAVILNDVYYSFTATDEVQVLTLNHNAPSDGYGISVYTACDGEELACEFVDLETNGTPITLTGLTPDETYVLRVMSMAAQAGPFDLCITGPRPPDTLSCDMPFFDTGGPGGQVDPDDPVPGDYGLSENHVTVICPEDAGDLAVVTFSAFSVETGWDALYVFDGNDTSAPMISSGNAAPNSFGNNVYGAGGWWGTTAPNNIAPNVVRASNPTGCLTFAFTSDGSVTALGWEAAVTCFTPNNACATAAEISCGGLYSGFTTDVPHSMPEGCGFNGDPSTGGQNWWVYTAVEDQEVTLSTCGASDFDLRISVFTGTSCDDLTCLAAVDDSPGCSNGSAQISFPTIHGNTYYIAVHGAGDAEGDYQMAVSCAPPCSASSDNDVCSAAAPLTAAPTGTGMMVTEDNSCAYNDAPTSCSGTEPVQGLWYSFNAGTYNHLTLTLADNGDNATYGATTLSYALYTGACTGLGANDEVACVNDASGVNSLSVTPGQDYLLLVYNSGGVGVEGSFGLMLEHPADNDASIAIVSPEEGLFCSTSIEPVVALTNNGDAPLTSLQFVYDIDGGTPQVYDWSGSLPYQASTNVSLPAIIASAGDHTLNIHVQLPNGQPDEQPGNDDQSVALNISGESVVVSVRTDANGGQLSWQIYDGFFFTVASGGPYTGQDNTTVNTSVCLPTTFGNCYSFFLFDSFGDGLCCANGNGYWELNTPGGATLLRDRFEATPDGSQSPATAPLSAGYLLGHEFCLPAGPSNILPDECGVFTNILQSKVYTRAIPGVASYQFEFSNPDAGFRRRIAVPRNWVKFSEMQTSPLIPGVTYFARARVDQGAAGFDDDHFGTGCEMAIDPNTGCTGLIDNPGQPTHSCGVAKHFGGSDKIWAQPVVGATQYRFRFTNAGEGFVRQIDRPSYVCLLSWVTTPLQAGATYDVQVNVLVNSVWSGFCGPTCQVTILSGTSRPERIGTLDDQAISLWPNPVGDGRVNLRINELADAQQRISVELYDVFGKRVMAQDFENTGSSFNTILHLPNTVAKGAYMVNITVNGQTSVQHLIVQ